MASDVARRDTVVEEERRPLTGGAVSPLTERPILTERPMLPLTEHVLGRLGRPRWLWIVIWSLVPLVSPLVFSAAIRWSGRPLDDAEFVDLAATQLGLAYACLVLLVGSGLLGRQTAELRDELARSVPGDSASDMFRRIGSKAGPVAAAGIVAAIVSVEGWSRYGPLPPLVALPALFVYLVPIMTFVWVYVTILVDLDRLGGRPLALGLFPQDRTLGLRKLGSLASTGLGLLLVAAAPVLLAGSDEPVTLGISLAIVGLTVAAFGLSMWRLHRQMSAAKAGYVAMAARLYADAYAPLREDPSLETLVAQSNALGAAKSLDERAHSLSTWPLDESALRFVAVVVTGVVTSMIVRGLFAALGE